MIHIIVDWELVFAESLRVERMSLAMTALFILAVIISREPEPRKKCYKSDSEETWKHRLHFLR